MKKTGDCNIQKEEYYLSSCTNGQKCLLHKIVFHTCGRCTMQLHFPSEENLSESALKVPLSLRCQIYNMQSWEFSFTNAVLCENLYPPFNDLCIYSLKKPNLLLFPLQD